MKNDLKFKQLLLVTILLSRCIITSSWNYRYLPRLRPVYTSRKKILGKTKCNTCNPISTSSTEAKFTEEENSQQPVCERITSKEAASIIEKNYIITKKSVENSLVENSSGLLVITSDASRGANRHTGLTAILRHINPTYGKDHVTIAAKRVNSMDARDIFQSEVSAIALGIKTAVQFIPSLYRKKILLLTDSNSALTFFCGDEENVKSPILDHPQYKFMQTLLEEADEVFMAKVKSAKSGSDGFFDHDTADVISSFSKTVSNKKLDTYFQRQHCVINNCSDENHFESMSNDVNRAHAMFETCCKCLSKQDLEYLHNSSDIIEDNRSNIMRKHLILKKESGERLKRCRDRIRIDLGLELNVSCFKS